MTLNGSGQLRSTLTCDKLRSHMAQIWSETYDPKRHHDRMFDVSRIPGVPSKQYWRAPTLQRYRVYFVRVCGFTFEFHSLEQLKVCLEFFNQKVRPSSKITISSSERRIQSIHWFAQRWFERLPMQLLEERRRVRIVPALKEALTKFNTKDHDSARKGGRKTVRKPSGAFALKKLRRPRYKISSSQLTKTL